MKPKKRKKILRKKRYLKIIRRKLEDKWPGKSIFMLTSMTTLNDDGRRSAELLSRIKADSTRSTFVCLVCDTCHSKKKCPHCKTHSSYSDCS